MKLGSQRGLARLLLLGTLIAAILVWPAQADRLSCPEALAGSKAFVAAGADYPSIGVMFSRDVYYLQTPAGVQKVGTRPELETFVLGALSKHASENRAAEIYLQGFNGSDAFNFVQSLRLRAANERWTGDLDAYSRQDAVALPTPVALAGNNHGGKPPPGTGGTSAAAEDPRGSPLPSSGNGNGGDGSGDPPGSDPRKPTDDLWKAAFVKLNERYNWSRAEVLEDTRPPQVSPSANFEPKPTAFLVRLPNNTDSSKPAGTATGSRPAIALQFSVLTFFKRGSARPPSSDVEKVIEAALHDENLRRATVQRAAREVVRNLDRTFLDSKSAIPDVLNMMIVLNRVDALG